MRELTGVYNILIQSFKKAFALLILYTGAFGVFPHMQQRALVVFFGLAITFSCIPFNKTSTDEKIIPIPDLVLIILAAIACFNIAFRYEFYMVKFFSVHNIFEYTLGVVLIILILEASRRSVGKVFIILILSIVIYCLFGHHIPGYWGHGFISYRQLLQYLYQSDLGIWGLVTGIIAALVSIFILFGALLQYSGGGETFIGLSEAIAGKYKGGPAMVAVIASALFGSISGSTVANVATTGNFTIPMMKKLGYKPEFAGGVEAAASTGGNVMPPVMGAGAFIMAEILGVPYLSICAAAAIPAILYFTSILFQVRFEAVKDNLKPMPKDEIPKIIDFLKWKYLSPLLIPVFTLLYFLFKGYDPYRACFYAFLVGFILYVFVDFNFNEMKKRFKSIDIAIESGIDALASMVPLLVCAQIFVSLISLSGVGTKMSASIMSLAGNNLFLGLVLAAIISLILGMSLPTTAAYLLAASVVAPSLISMKVVPLSAHLFIFYFAIISALTPPVCEGAFVGAMIAKTDWLKVAWVAMKLSIVSYIMPFLFIYDPVFLLIGGVRDIIIGFVTAIIGIIFVSSGLVGYFNKKINLIVRFLFLLGGIFMFLPDKKTNILAIPILLIGFGIIYSPLLFHRKE